VIIRPGEMVLATDIRKTKFINQNLNPVWNDEYFDYFIVDETPFLITGMDKDVLVADDPLGCCQIVIDEDWINTEQRGEEFWMVLKEGDLGKEVAKGFISNSFDSPTTGPVTSGEIQFKVLWQRSCANETLQLFKEGLNFELRRKFHRSGESANEKQTNTN